MGRSWLAVSMLDRFAAGREKGVANRPMSSKYVSYIVLSICPLPAEEGYGGVLTETLHFVPKQAGNLPFTSSAYKQVQT